MAKEKSKKKHVPQSYSTKLLKRVNSTKFTRLELMKFADEVHRLKPKYRDFEGRAITAIRFFENSDRAMSAMFRMEAFARIVSHGRLDGWTRPGDKKGMSLTRAVLFDAAVRRRGRWF